ncbi:MAG TPA: hypothetical protein VN893_03240 [Bryobacteraceae bacterium]|nr:hypothetical protein [Bryobacteraceae bacterium]
MKITNLIVAGAVFAATVFGQTVDQRRENQQDRVAQGIASGQLTPGETTRIEHQEAGVNHQIHQDRTANGGTLTEAERQQVNHEQNGMSREIYSDKHNANQTNFRGEVGARQELQQQRIAQGVRSGSLTAGETARLEGKQAGINHEVRADRAANGGTLTSGERRQVNRQQNRTSGQIYRAKHNAARQPK